MSQLVLNFHYYSFILEIQKTRLLSAATVSILWVLSGSCIYPCFANPSQTKIPQGSIALSVESQTEAKSLSAAEILVAQRLLVPSSSIPSNQQFSGAKTAPPPPDTATINTNNFGITPNTTYPSGVINPNYQGNPANGLNPNLFQNKYNYTQVNPGNVSNLAPVPMMGGTPVVGQVNPGMMYAIPIQNPTNNPSMAPMPMMMVGNTGGGQPTQVMYMLVPVQMSGNAPYMVVPQGMMMMPAGQPQPYGYGVPGQPTTGYMAPLPPVVGTAPNSAPMYPYGYGAVPMQPAVGMSPAQGYPYGYGVPGQGNYVAPLPPIVGTVPNPGQLNYAAPQPTQTAPYNNLSTQPNVNNPYLAPLPPVMGTTGGNQLYSLPSTGGETADVVLNPVAPLNLGQGDCQRYARVPGQANFVCPPGVGQLPSLPGAPSTQEFVAPGSVNPAPQAPQTIPPARSRDSRLLRSTALREPSLTLQGVYLNQGDQTSARARLSGIYPLTPQVLFGATLDLTNESNTFADSPNQGLNVNELYLAAALPNLPNLRFAVGQLDLTSYFDRNSFAKDGTSQFFNSTFQTNPALANTGISSRPGFLVNWSVTDNIEAKAAVFSSANSIGNFALDGFAGEIGLRFGNAIIRGTYASDRDAGNRSSFREAFAIPRNLDNTAFGPQRDDREEAYGINGEVFIPSFNLGLFGRFGHYINRDLDRDANTFSFGATLFDVFSRDDRLGLAYGRDLSNNELRSRDKDELPDVLELFYDFKFLENFRLGFTLQQRNEFNDTYAGFRLRTEFDVTPRGRVVP